MEQQIYARWARGLSNFMNLLGAKRLGLLTETVPNANAPALLNLTHCATSSPPAA